MTMLSIGRALKRLLIGHHLSRESSRRHHHIANISFHPAFQDACPGMLPLWFYRGLHIREERLPAVCNIGVHDSAHFLNRRLHVSSSIQVIDTAVVCRQHDILERVTKDAGEFPVEVNKDIELRRAAPIMKELSNGGLESPHVELDHGVMWEGEGKEIQGGSL
jgi:hypothetical protein